MALLGFLPGVLDFFSNASISVSRPGAVSVNANGVASRAASTTFTTAAYVERPAGSDMLLHLPEGDRVKRTCVVWSKTELRYRDLLSFDGEVYEVQHVEPWGETAGFWRVIGVKTQQ